MNKHCSLCNDSFDCGADRPEIRCWCETYPEIMPLARHEDCQCPGCLGRTIGNCIDALIRTSDTATMVRMAAAYRSDHFLENIDYTIEDGKYVFSTWFHLKRGRCCGSGCRHCPYPRGQA